MRRCRLLTGSELGSLGFLDLDLSVYATSKLVNGGRLLAGCEDLTHARDARLTDGRRYSDNCGEGNLDLLYFFFERALNNNLVAFSSDGGNLIDGGYTESSCELNVYLTSIEVSGTVASEDQVVIGNLVLNDALQNLSGCEGISGCQSIISNHDELVNAARKDILLQLSVGSLGGCSTDNSNGTVVSSSELSCSFDSVLVVRADDLMSLRVVKRTIASDEDVLVVSYYFNCDNNFHNFLAPILLVLPIQTGVTCSSARRVTYTV